jgi:hypothetical protein
MGTILAQIDMFIVLVYYYMHSCLGLNLETDGLLSSGFTPQSLYP